MKAQWLSKHFGLKAGVALALVGATAAVAAVPMLLPEPEKQSIAVQVAAPQKAKPKPVTAAPLPVVARQSSLFLSISSIVDVGYTTLYTEFCNENVGVCGGLGDASAVMLTTETMKFLTDVNIGVNKAVKYTSDMELYGVRGKFALPKAIDDQPPKGDCEDYAFLKRDILKKHIPMETMMIALVKEKASGGDHAVLVVRTTGGDYILDNRHSEVKLAREAAEEYTFNFLSRPENDAFVSRIIPIDETNDLALLNTYGVRPAALKGPLPTSAEEIQLTLAPTTIVVVAQVPKTTPAPVL